MASPGGVYSPHFVTALRDYHLLRNRGYPARPTLDLVGNRYALSADQRNILYRGIQSDEVVRRRRKRFALVADIRGRPVVVDGYNVLRTVAAALYGRPVFLCLDGWVRDAGGTPEDSRDDPVHRQAREMISDTLVQAGASDIGIYFDEPVEGSTEEAARWAGLFTRRGISGKALTAGLLDAELRDHPAIVATADGEIIDGRNDPVVDLAGLVLGSRDHGGPRNLAEWTDREAGATP